MIVQEGIEELTDLFSMAESYGFSDFLIFDASVVRGLAYYTGVVFECFDRKGELRAIAGGGRYDRLMNLYGSNKEIPCCGFGFGDCVSAVIDLNFCVCTLSLAFDDEEFQSCEMFVKVIMELLIAKKLQPTLPRGVDFVVAAYDNNMIAPAMKVAALLRELSYSVDLIPGAKKRVASAFDYADRAVMILSLSYPRSFPLLCIQSLMSTFSITHTHGLLCKNESLSFIDRVLQRLLLSGLTSGQRKRSELKI